MLNDLVFYCPQGGEAAKRFNWCLAEIASERSLPYQFVNSASPETLTLLRQAKYVIVWNGSHPFTSWVLNARRRNRLAVVSAQRAFIDGDNHLMFDRGGNCTDSELVRMEDYSNTTQGDVLAFRAAFQVDKSFEDARTLVIGETRTNAEILGFNQFVDERDYLGFAIERCGRDNLVYRPPIENDGFREMIQVCEELDIGFSNPAEETWSECLAKYSSGLGASSHRLNDFAVRGKPVVSLGESLIHFLENEGDNLEQDIVFAECWRRQFGTDAGNSEICERLAEIDGFEEFGH